MRTKEDAIEFVENAYAMSQSEQFSEFTEMLSWIYDICDSNDKNISHNFHEVLHELTIFVQTKTAKHCNNVIRTLLNIMD